jgi:thiol-disulfide isomerase/thioredoxin
MKRQYNCHFPLRILASVVSLLLVSCVGSGPARAADQQLVTALKIKPVQAPVDYDQPTPEAVEKCTLSVETKGLNVGWFLRNDSGQLLRRFVDTNKDKNVDQWCYYKNGIEVYRDIDSNFNGKADQYRWLGTAGMRWGIDRNGDQRIDSWKTISAAEVSLELVWALKDADLARFQAILLSEVDLRKLNLGDELADRLKQKQSESVAGFVQLARRQQLVKKTSRWVHFGAGIPGLLPAGTAGVGIDLVVQDNAAALIEDGDRSGQLFVGSLVQVGACWKLIDMPRHLDGEQPIAAQGFFLQVPVSGAQPVGPVPMGLSQAEQELVEQLEAIDRQLVAAALQQKTELHEKRADLIEKLIQAAREPQQKSNWIRQLADTLSAAVQSGDFPAGVGRLTRLTQQLSQQQGHPDTAYVTISLLTASYGQSLERPGADYEKIQQKWIDDLTQLMVRFPNNPDAAEAMFQLAIALEFAGETGKAIPWYRKINNSFPKSAVAAKAAGAVRRLEAKGKVIQVAGTSLDGNRVDVATFRGRSKLVVVHYWASWAESYKEEMQLLKQLQARHGSDLVVLGVNLDMDATVARKVITDLGVSWPQLFEKGGMDSRLANEMGVVSLPTLLVIDATGKVLHTDLHVTKLEQLLGTLK